MPNKYFISVIIIALITSLILIINFDKVSDDNYTINSNRDSGFYLNPFKLILTSSELSSDDYTIHYTFDGSKPTCESEIFSDKILITGRESYFNLSAVKTTIIDSISNFPEKWIAPKPDLKTASIVKCAVFKNDILCSNIRTFSFFIKNDFINDSLTPILLYDSIEYNNYGLPVISISTNKNNLYSQSEGLFIPGDNFDFSNPNSGNFFERGIDFEREVYFQYFGANSKLNFELNIGMRIHGGVSRRFPQKSLKFYKRKKYDKTNIDFPFLAQKRVKRFIVEGMQESGGGRALIEDIVAQEIVKEIGLEQQSFQAVIVFVNGEYWGLHSIRDRIDEHYLSYKFDLHRDSFDIIDGHARKGFNAIHGDNSDYIELLKYADNYDLSLPKHYSFVLNKVDIDNFIDYYAVEVFFANLDWPIQNIKMWKMRKNGKWRFLLYDLDGGFRHKGKNDVAEDYLFDMFSYLQNTNECKRCLNPPKSTLLFSSLSKNPDFKQHFANRYKEIIDVYMDTSITIPIVDSITSIYDPYMNDHIKRWGFPKSKERQWKRDIRTHIKKFLINREEHTLDNLHNYLITND